MPLDWMRNPEKIPSIPGIRSGLIELCEILHVELGDGAVMYELGSFAGESAVMFAVYFATVHCVDPWEDPCGAPSIGEVEGSFDERARIFGNLVKHKGTSEAVAPAVADGSLDFVYIDAGNHSYERALTDMRLWRPKVRPGGFIGGHDWEIPDLHAADTFPGVKQAFHEIFGLELPRIFADTSWLVRVPA